MPSFLIDRHRIQERPYLIQLVYSLNCSKIELYADDKKKIRFISTSVFVK